MKTHTDETGAAQAAAPAPVTLVDRLAWLGGLVSAVLIVLILAVTTVSVLFRYFLGMPLLGVDDGTGFLVVATVMFGAAEALRRNDHINIDLLTAVLPAPVRHALDILAQAAVLVFAGVLLASAWRTVTFSLRFDNYSTGELEMPLWIPQSTMLVGAVLLGLVAATRLLSLILRKRAA